MVVWLWWRYGAFWWWPVFFIYSDASYLVKWKLWWRWWSLFACILMFICLNLGFWFCMVSNPISVMTYGDLLLTEMFVCNSNVPFLLIKWRCLNVFRHNFFSRPVLFLWNINVQSDDERVMDVMKFLPLLSVMILYQRFYGCDKMTLVMIAILIINGDIYYCNSKWWS